MTEDSLAPMIDNLREVDQRIRGPIWGARPAQERAAAVLALLGRGEHGTEIVLTERSRQMRSHPGQISLPGGAAEPSDGDLAATALREANEEVGLDPGSAEVLGSLPPVNIPRSGFTVTTVVARWIQPHELRFADPGEVEAIHQVPITVLVDPEHRAMATFPQGPNSPAFIFDDPGNGQEVFVWGMTGLLLDAVLRLGGWARPWDRSRTVPVPANRR